MYSLFWYLSHLYLFKLLALIKIFPMESPILLVIFLPIDPVIHSISVGCLLLSCDPYLFLIVSKSYLLLKSCLNVLDGFYSDLLLMTWSWFSWIKFSILWFLSPLKFWFIKLACSIYDISGASWGNC